MSEPIQNLLRVEPDKIRVSGYYDDEGKLTNLDVILNRDMALADLGAIVGWLIPGQQNRLGWTAEGYQYRKSDEGVTTLTFNGRADVPTYKGDGE